MTPAPRDAGGGGGGPPSWETPPEIFDPLNAVYAFTLDAAATHHNTRVPGRYCTETGTFYNATSEVGEGAVTVDGIPRIRYDPRHGLDYDWGLRDSSRHGELSRVWLNPPWSGLMPWVRKAAISTLRSGVTTVALLPARLDGAWFHRWVKPYADITFLEGRIKFIHPPEVCSPRCVELKHKFGEPGGGPPEGAMICVYR